jgi:hypothetical protein
MNLDERKHGRKRQAFLNVTKACDFSGAFPDHVFTGKWAEFLFFQSDYIFSPDFTNFIHQLLRIEHADVACLLNIDRTESFTFEKAALILIDVEMDGTIFGAKLRAGGPLDGWLFAIDRYACSSDGGEWCIYCEKENDVAVIGFRNLGGSDKFQAALKGISAKPIESLISGGCSPLIPFNRLTSIWCEGLIKNYGCEKRWK